MTFDEAVTLLLRDARTAHRSPATLRAYTTDVASVGGILRAQGCVDVAQLEVRDLRVAFATYASTHSPASVVRARATWRRLFGVLVEDGVVASSPMASVAARVSVPRRYPKPLVGWEKNVGAVLLQGTSTASARSTSAWPARDRALIGLLLATGLRSGEAADLNVGSVLRHADGAAELVVWGKGRKQRTVPLAASLLVAIDDYLVERREGTTLGVTRVEDPLFVARVKSGAERRMTTGQIAYAVTRVARQAGLHGALPQGAVVHALRHTFGSTLARSGEPLHHVAALMGHGSIATTQGYLQPVREDVARALEQAARELGL